MERGPIRWRKGELIGAGAYGRVYMGMNLDSGELIAVKQVLIASNSVAKEKAQAHITELEEEVKLLQNLSHTNIVRYLGTAREEEALNIFLEFVPGGSIASLLGKFGSFPEAVIRMYTRQLLLGLEYLHKNHIMHRDIKGANILVDNEGQIKVADFGASKKVVELATITGAKSMKGTPYWMAPEVIRQTGHNWRADIWSVGCTVIEMATGKPPWSQQFQEVAALFHIGTTKSHPPIPEHLSEDAKTFLLQCLQREPNLRPTASQLLQHPFVLEEGVVDSQDNGKDLLGNTFNQLALRLSHAAALSNKDNKIKHDDLNCSMRLDSPSSNNSFNPMSEPDGPDIECSKEQSPKAADIRGESMDASRCLNKEDYADCPSYVDDDEVTESKIRAFLEEKASELKKLQTPLYEEYYGFWNKTAKTAEGQVESKCSPVKSGLRTQFGMTISSPNKSSFQIGKPADGGGNSDFESSPNKGNMCRRNYNTLFEISLPRTNEFRARLQDVSSPGFRERQKQWEDELWQELQAQREERRRAGHLSGKKSQKGTWTISATSQPDPI